MEPVRTLLDRTEEALLPVLPHELREIYGGDLSFPAAFDRRPYVIGNFVATLDGVTSYRIPGKAGGGEISGYDTADRFIMGLLRASVDAVLVGSGTLRATPPEHLWTPGFICPVAANLYDEYRELVLGKRHPPRAVVVSASGDVELNRAVFQTPGLPALILTTKRGRDRLTRAGINKLASTELIVLDDSASLVPVRAALEFLRIEGGVQHLLHEGGPTLFGQFVAEGLVDEFFLTLSPQIAGNSLERPRPTMISGTEFLPETAPRLQIMSVKQRGSHLYLRYRSSR